MVVGSAGLNGVVMPCRGKSIATVTKPASANKSRRLRVMPCWKITTGQPPAGALCPELAFGTVTSTGISSVSVGTGTGLKRVVRVLVMSSGKGGACQYSVSGALRLRKYGMLSTPTYTSASPGSAGFTRCVLRPVGFTLIGSAGPPSVVAVSSSSESTVDSVVKLKLRTMFAGFRLLANG